MPEYFTIPEGKEPSRESVVEEMHTVYAEKAVQFPQMFPDNEKQRQDWVDFMFDSFMSAARAKVGVPLDTVPYTDEVDDIGDLMTVEDWVACCESGAFIDYDGYGKPVRADHVELPEGGDPTKYPTIEFRVAQAVISPSARHLVPKDATHFLWYNR